MNIDTRLKAFSNNPKLDYEMAQRINLSVTACIMLERYNVKPDTFYKELERLRPLYNKKYHNLQSLKHQKNRSELVLEREKKLVCMILEHYINKKEYDL